MTSRTLPVAPNGHTDDPVALCRSVSWSLRTLTDDLFTINPSSVDSARSVYLPLLRAELAQLEQLRLATARQGVPTIVTVVLDATVDALQRVDAMIVSDPSLIPAANLLRPWATGLRRLVSEPEGSLLDLFTSMSFTANERHRLVESLAAHRVDLADVAAAVSLSALLHHHRGTDVAGWLVGDVGHDDLGGIVSRRDEILRHEPMTKPLSWFSRDVEVQFAVLDALEMFAGHFAAVRETAKGLSTGWIGSAAELVAASEKLAAVGGTR